MKMSILILTHNRPHLFKRCLESVLQQLPDDVDVYVNNDSNDITEIHHPRVTYYYKQFDNLSQIYQFLLSKATGEYVYFLEDDDYLVNGFTSLPLHADIVAGNYCPTYEVSNQLHYMRLYQDAVLTPKEFVDGLNLEDLQLSQFIFKTSTITDFDFPMDNNVHNDINLVMYSATRATQIQTLNKVFYYQTIDGGDNISFKGTLPDINVTASYAFINKYAGY